IAKQYQSSKHMSFGISMSPGDLAPQLDDPKRNLTDFANAAKLTYKDSGIGSYGTLGLPRTVQDFKFQEPLKNWYKSLTTVTKGFGNRSLVFLGLKIQDAGTKISADKKLANDLFSTLKDIGITLFVLITHNVEEQAGDKCSFVPISSMYDAAYKDKSLPALEHAMKLVTAGLAVYPVEVAFSFSMVYLAYRMKTTVKADSKKQGACVHNAPMTFDTYCIEPAPNEKVDSDSLTASNYQGTTLRTYETVETITKKMEKVVFPVDDKAYRRPGWALFDIQVEIYDDVLCQRNISKPAVFARLIAAKNILEKNRKRTFPPGR
ncbi:hypothetical protein ISCGN_024904, partial [Ixodes scapularis]